MKLTYIHVVLLQILFLISGFFAYVVGREYVSIAPMILLAFPAYLGLLKYNWKKGLLFIGILSVYATLIEATSVLTGFPYGYFLYSDALGMKLFGVVPWAVSFGWVPLVIGGVVSAYALIPRRFLTRNVWLYVLSVVLIVFSDLVLDPGAVALGFWSWITTSSYYTIPLSNYVGWFFSSLIGVGLFLWMYSFKEIKKIPFWSNLTLVLGVAFWVAVTFFAGMYLATFLGVVLLVMLNWVYLKN